MPIDGGVCIALALAHSSNGGERVCECGGDTDETDERVDDDDSGAVATRSLLVEHGAAPEADAETETALALPPESSPSPMPPMLPMLPMLR